MSTPIIYPYLRHLDECCLSTGLKASYEEDLHKCSCGLREIVAELTRVIKEMEQLSASPAPWVSIAATKGWIGRLKALASSPDLGDGKTP